MPQEKDDTGARSAQQLFLKLVDDLQKLVASEQENGVRFIELTDAPGTFVSGEATPKPAVPASKEAGARDPVAALKAIAERIASCQRCELANNRTKTVPGQGSAQPDIMFIGEGPGEEEDRQGLAFVGRAGQLLTRIIAAMGYTRDQVFIGNIVKCRPPGNRTPYPHEMQACLPYLIEQIDILKPKVIVALGATAVRGLLGIEMGISKLRGRWLDYQGIPVMPTYHPAYLLRNESAKKDVWADMLQVLDYLGRKPPSISRPKRT